MSWRQYLYLANFALLVTHEIDSAYWREWELLHIPGGIQVFLLLNLPLVAVFMFGFRAVTLELTSSRLYSRLLAASGLLAVVVHTVLLGQGHPQFTLPASLLVLALTAVASVALFVDTFRGSRRS